MKLAWMLLLVLLSCGLPLPSQTAGDNAAVKLEFSQLQDERTAKQAAHQLQTLAKSNPDVLAYLSTNLPPVIEEHARGTVWLNAVRLAGDLKIVSAVNVLVSELGKKILVGL